MVHNDQYDFDDLGLTADVALAFADLGLESEALSSILDAFAADPSEYTTGEGYGDTGSQYAGQTAKLATVVQQGGRDATAFGGHDLIAELETVVVDDGDEAGRGVDVTPVFGTDYSNTIGQSFVVRALTDADSDERDAAVSYLVKQQCSSGEFRINMFKDGTVARECGGTGDVLSVDATAFAVQALLAADKAGAAGAASAIEDATDWFLANQASDGSFSDAGTPNSNSTGLAAAALASVDQGAAATKAANWLVKVQATASTPGLEDEVGAIAFDSAALDAADPDGITATNQDQFRRATAQAATGIDSAVAPEPGPVDSMKLALSDAKPTQGDTITITATGKDADGQSTGDVSDELSLKSSVESDTIDGNTVTFNHASPHTITATHVPTGTTAAITIEVEPLADETPTTDSGDGSGGDDTDLVSQLGRHAA